MSLLELSLPREKTKFLMTGCKEQSLKVNFYQSGSVVNLKKIVFVSENEKRGMGEG